MRHSIFFLNITGNSIPPVSLTCGHIFCYMCACSAATVTVVNVLKAAEPKEKCPLCREAGVYEDPVKSDRFMNLNQYVLIRIMHLFWISCGEYWEQRLQTERAERIRQVKEHWESECRAFVGV
ncbi:probable E3 ubiquitin-protein ligase BAH1-like 1 [Hibiscus syriacus]|uniref:probable E3 ubiquitin-protein ligase BAH1-like 1 n=1 Tax=Hibiscus syriacus TaxID=106335 RepID=UPI001923796B|nr:probable E3 ubiquitin-protein ligase BAH1-like 1 [Hibiscus syriacus]